MTDTTTDNPYTALLAEEASRMTRAQVTATDIQTAEVNPDAYATHKRVAGYLGYPVAAVEATPKQSVREYERAKLVNDTAQAPVLARQYTDDDFAKLAKGDSGPLALFETVANSFRRGVPGLKQNLSATALRSNANTLAQLDSAQALLDGGKTGLTLQQDPQGIEFMTPDQRVAFRAQIGAAAGNNAETIVAAQVKKAALPSPAVVQQVMQAKGWGEAITAFSKDPLQFIAAIGPESLVQSAPGLIAAIPAGIAGGPAAAAAVAGGGSFATDYGSSLLEGLAREGVDINNADALKAAAQNTKLMQSVAAQAMAHASVVGMVDGASGGLASRLALPKAVATRLAKAPVARELANLAVQTPVQGAFAGLGEAGGELAAGQPLDPGNILAEIVGEAFTAPAEVASIAGGKVRERMAQASEAKAHAAQLAEVSKAAAQSKLRERDPASFAKFAAEATDGAEMFVDANVFHQMPAEQLQQLVAAVPGLGAQLEEADQAGGDISISVADFAAHIAGTPAAELLMQHARRSPDAMTAAEAEAYKPDEHLQSEVDALLPAEPAQLTPQQTAIAAARDAVAQQLSKINRFTPAVNAQYVDLIGAYVGATAQRAGLDVDAIGALVPRIVSSLGLEVGPTLDQGPTLDTVQKAWGDAGVQGAMNEKDGVITLSQLVVPEASRNAGKGTAAMRALVDYADVTGQHVALTPSGDFGGTKSRLTTFYKRFGFIENKGKNRAFSTSESMYRLAAGKVLHQGERGAFEPNSKTIALLEHADLSTFLHETGHFFLTSHADLASREGAPAQLVGDMGAVLKWFGVPDLATWNGMTLEQQRPHHEEFARAFEKYLGEGKAPTVELQGAFARFRGWLLSVYRSLTALNVNLTDDVRGVFDRMLATDSDIADVQSARALAPLFESAAAAGMTPDEFARYQATGEQATEEAVGELQARSIRDLQHIASAKAREVRKLNAEAKRKRDAIEATVRAEVDATPIYAAWRDLARGKTADGEPIRLSRVDVEQTHAELVDRVPAAMMANVEHALPADVIADAYGLSSGDELVKLLATLDSPEVVIDAETDQRFLEQHAELSTPQGIERAAHLAIANDVRGKVLATELGALTKATGGVQMLTRGARQFADAAVARRKVRELKPAQHRAAEVRAGRAAADAFRKGDTATAASKKREQLLQHVIGRRTTAAVVEVGKAIDYLSKFDSAATRKAIGPEYADQVDQLLERFDLRTSPSLKAIDKRKSLAAWVESQEALGLSPVIDDRLLAESKLKSYRDMTVEELRGLVDTVKNIEHLGRLKERLLTVQDQRTFSEIATAVADGIVKHGGKVRDIALEGEKGVKPWLEGALAAHRKLGSLAYQMDGAKDDGPVYRALVRPMNEAATREETAIMQATEKLAELYRPLQALKGGTNGAKVFIAEIGASLSRGGRLSVALNWGNEGNRQRLLDGQHWTVDQVQAVLRTLSPVELQFVNQVHEYIDSFWPEVKAQQLRVSGVVEDKVEASPWTATTSDGSKVEMRGGYYPAKYDTARSAKAEQHDAAQVAKDMLQGAYVRAATRRGHTKERSEEVKDRPLRLDLNVITQHVNEVVHNLHWQEWLIDANRLIGSKAIDGAIRAHYGPAVVRTIKDDVAGIAGGDVVPGTAIDAGLLFLRGNVTRSTLGLSFTTALMQPFGLSNSVARIGAVPVLRGLARWAGDASRFESSTAWIREKSPMMSMRARTMNKELREISARVGGKSQTMQVVDAGLMFMTSKAQQLVDTPTWIGAYEKALAAGGDEKAAIALADEAVLSSQGGGQTKDLAEVQRKHPLLTQFYSYFSTTLNLTAAKTAQVEWKSPKAVAGWLGDMALLAVIPALGPAIVTELLRGTKLDDPDKWAKKLAQWQAAYLLSMVVGVREFAGIISGFSYSGAPVGRIVTDTGKVAQQAGQGEVDEPAVLAMARLIADVTGIPVVQVIRSYKGWKEWEHGHAPASSVLFGPPSKD
jgi:hypothetical protein